MREESLATWDGGKTTWGGRVGVYGTVPVCLCVHRKAGVRGQVFGGKIEFVSDNSNADIESFSPSPIPNEDSDSRMEEIDLTFTPEDPMPPSNEKDDYDSERDILICEELLDNYSLSLSENESFHFDIPSFSRPPAKPPDGDTGILNIKMMGDNSEQKKPIVLVCFVLILVVQYSQKLEDSCQSILSSKSSFPQLQLGIKYPNLID
nr:hypothetical protein [Tanacetum cinerariifolium]